MLFVLGINKTALLPVRGHVIQQNGMQVYNKKIILLPKATAYWYTFMQLL